MAINKLENASEFLGNHEAVEWHLGWESNSTAFDFRRVPMGEKISQELADEVQGAIDRRLSQIGSGRKELVEYEAHHLTHGNSPIMHSTVEDHPASDKLNEIVERTNIKYLENVSNRPNLQTIKLEDHSGNELYAICKFVHQQIVGQKNWTYLVTSGKEFDKFEKGLLRFPSSIDAIIWDSSLFIFKPGSFNSAINFTEQMKEIAQDSLQMAREEGLHTTEPEMLEEAIMNRTEFLKKMGVVRDRGIPQSLNIDKVDEIANEYNMDISVQETEDGKKIDIPNKNKVREYIRLLNDSNVRSDLTDEKYYASAKKPVT